jgi:hypothetical protein
VSGKTSTRRLGKAYSLIAYVEAKAYGYTDKARTVTGLYNKIPDSFIIIGVPGVFLI